MELRQAILRAADHIESYPREFYFYAQNTPREPHCGSPGCALGWIGAFAKLAWFAGVGNNNVDCPLHQAMGVDESNFYLRLKELSGSYDWMKDASLCARMLRLYADKYHPADKLSGSEVCREIMGRPFRETAEA